MSAALLNEIKDGVALVTLNNPPLNLVTLQTSRDLHDLFIDLSSDPAVRVVILTGSGNRAFCVGSDISEFPQMMDADLDIICGLYPKKEINWQGVEAAVRRGTPTNQLKWHTGRMVVNLVDGRHEAAVPLYEPVEKIGRAHV